MAKSDIQHVHLCGQWLKQATSVTESTVNFLFWNTISFSGCYIFLFLRFSSQDCLLCYSLPFRVFSLPAPSCSYSCVLRATYFLQSYDNKLNQRFAWCSTTHSSFSLPSKPLLSFTLLSNATQSSMCHISPQLVNHFYTGTVGTFYHIL